VARRPETIETTSLAIELMRHIPRGRKITAKALHEQLLNAGIERELSTIQRQLEMLSHHFAIDCDTRNRPYGYCWSKNAMLNWFLAAFGEAVSNMERRPILEIAE
jgi:hypothetical protein